MLELEHELLYLLVVEVGIVGLMRCVMMRLVSGCLWMSRDGPSVAWQDPTGCSGAMTSLQEACSRHT